MRQRRSKFLAFAGLAAGLVVAAVPAATSAQEPAAASVTLVHGVRGLIADIWLDGALALAAFEPERTTDALAIPAGPHTVEVRTAGAAPESTPVVSANVDLPAGAQLSAVVHLAQDGSPTVTLYPDDVSQVPAGEARVVVRHAAAAPPIDVDLDGAPLAAALPNSGQAGTATGPGSHTIAVALEGAPAPALPPQDVPIAEGSSTILYLVGSASDNSLVWLAQQRSGVQTAPTAVRSGTDGLAVPGSFPMVAVLLLGAVVIVSATRLVVAWRR
ncbi:MAG: DUF4397 domain-containing protein [Acidimicrobiales bacterium]